MEQPRVPAQVPAVSWRTAIVYGVVGLVATGAYLGLTLGLNRLLGLPAWGANAVGFVVAVLVSYTGHHRLTFNRQGDHGRYFVRFLLSTALMLGLTTLWTWAATHALGLSPTLAALAVVGGYPPCSYLLNALWTFRA